MAASPQESAAATVLIVDDERNVADLYATWVEMEADYETRVAYDGEAALETLVADGDPPDDGDDGPTAAVDAVLLDRRMPGMSGDEVLATIRDRGYDVPVAMVTAVKPEDAPLEADYQEYLTKPVMRDDVGRVVRTLVEYDSVDEVDDEGEGEDADPSEDDADDEGEGEGAAASEEPDGQVSEDVRETLDDVTERLDQIQESVDPGDEVDDDESEDDDDLVTAEDIRTKVSRAEDGDDE